MKKLFSTILVLGLLLSGNAYAGGPCGLGWFIGSILDNTKEHKICGQYARNLEGDSFQQDDAYCDCRERLQLENLKKKALRN